MIDMQAVLLSAEERLYEKGPVRCIFDPTPPAGVSTIDHFEYLKTLIVNITDTVWRRTSYMFRPNCILVENSIAHYMDFVSGYGSKNPIAVLPYTEPFCMPKGEIWLMLSPYYEMEDNSRVWGRPVGIISVVGHVETEMEYIANCIKGA